MMASYCERVLFVAGEPNTGKSVQLRGMFRDVRFGTAEAIPISKRIRSTIRLSNERVLIIRLTSPHEWGNAPDEFMDNIQQKTGSRRWCFAGALQLTASGKMPDLVESVELLFKRFNPERIRVCFLSPDYNGTTIQETGINLDRIIDRLRKIPGVECVCIDARDRTANGLFLADFFDFA